MTVIELSAGRKHTIKVGDKVQEVTLQPNEVRYLPFLRAVMARPKVPAYIPPKKTSVTYTEWSRARPTPSFDDIIAMVEGIRGRRDLGFKPTIDNLVSLLRKFRK